MRRVWRRARVDDVRRGGRCSVHRGLLLLWSRSAADDPARLVGAARVRWCWPRERAATIHEVAWHPTRGDEAEIWRTLDDLAGRSVVPVDLLGQLADERRTAGPPIGAADRRKTA